MACVNQMQTTPCLVGPSSMVFFVGCLCDKFSSSWPDNISFQTREVYNVLLRQAGTNSLRGSRQRMQVLGHPICFGGVAKLL